MGLYHIECPQCKRTHLRFSGSADQRCPHCQPCAPSAVSPRPAVLGDICDWRKCSLPSAEVIENVKSWYRTRGQVHVRWPYQYLPVNLHNLPRSADRAEMRRQVQLRVKIERELDAARAEINRQDAVIIKLEEQAKADEAFMMWQSAEIRDRRLDLVELSESLTKARNHLARVRYHCDLPEVGDSGPGT